MQRGHDGGKKIAGRERHIVVGTTGLLMRAVVHADIRDTGGAELLFETVKVQSQIKENLGRYGLLEQFLSKQATRVKSYV